ncbi:MAG TPA: AlkA N-terminal domain-containing protein [Actinomycetota bacterium]|nr:AlkA N-terminal domain-containing protein [Actinomycetota bacterium]
MIEDFERCYRAVASKDARFDGVFITGVTSTGIYCRPSCPAITPKRSNVLFFATPAAAQAAGLRACKRCRPDATPGSPEWDLRADLVGRAMRLIADGVVDREGVGGLARRLHFSERHLHRQLLAELGAGPQAIARAHRAQTARLLIETTGLTFSEIAFASGFASIRQFNDTVRAVFASTPSELRSKTRRGNADGAGTISLRLPFRAPFDGSSLLAFLGTRAVPGVEAYDGITYRRTLRLPHNDGIVELSSAPDHVVCRLRLGDLRDLAAAVQRCRRLLDLDADPIAIDEALGADPLLKRSVLRSPGIRVPGTVDGEEIAFRAVLGQQVSVRGARTLAGRLVSAFGKPITTPSGPLTHVFPEADALAEADLGQIGMPAGRRAALNALATMLASGRLTLDPGADRSEARAGLLSLKGIGPWTASYVEMRALRDPDAFLPTDLGVRRALERSGAGVDAETLSQRWRPWRSYALQHLWRTLDEEER